MRVETLIPVIGFLAVAGTASAAPVKENTVSFEKKWCILGLIGTSCGTTTTTTSSAVVTSTSAASTAKVSTSTSVAQSSTKASSTVAATSTTSASWSQCTSFDWSPWSSGWSWGGGFSVDYVKAWYLDIYGLNPPPFMTWHQVSALVSEFGTQTSVANAKATSSYTHGCSNPWTSAAGSKATSTAKVTTTAAVSSSTSKAASTSSAASASKSTSVVVATSSAAASKASSSASSAAATSSTVVASSASVAKSSSVVASSAATSSVAASSAVVSSAAASSVVASSAAASSVVAASAAASSVVASSAAVSSVAASSVVASSAVASTASSSTTAAAQTSSAVVATVNSSVSSSSSASSASATTSTAAATSSAATINGYSSQGCWQEISGRLLSSVQTSSSSMTIESCTATCESYGYTVAGVEYGDECYCGSYSDLTNAAVSGQCNMACAGDSTEICGGPNALNVYYNPSVVAATVNLPSGWTTYGVVAEGTNGRALTYTVGSNSNNTIESCANSCAALGYTVSGTEYSSECYCGNGFSNGGGALQDASAAFMACSGDLAETCGGPSILSVVTSIVGTIPSI